MSETSRPWQGTSVGDAGPYSSDNWTDLQRYMLSASKGDSGPLLGSGTSPDAGLTVQATAPASAAVKVTPGAALVNGTFYLNDADATVAVTANSSGNPRIDTIVLRKDWTAQTVRLAIKQGTAAATPTPPAITQTASSLWEEPIADIAVANGFTTIATSDVTPRHAYANAANGIYLLDILNNSGVTLETGDVVVWDSTTNRAVTTTTDVGSGFVAGVWVGRTINGAYGRVLVRGIGFVKMAAAINRAEQLITSGVVKTALAVAGPTISQLGRIGMAMETTSGAGLCLVHVDVKTPPHPALASIARDNGGNYTTSLATYADVDGTNLIIYLNVTSGRLFCVFTCSVYSDTNTGRELYMAINIDGTDEVIERWVLDGATARVLTMHVLKAGLSVGQHIIKIRWRIAAGTATMWADNTAHPVLTVIEV